jgi:hypothetical protein
MLGWSRWVHTLARQIGSSLLMVEQHYSKW